ncbi:MULTISPECIES: alpha/beta hydrolase family protein [Auritidibacter]|nr:MULTISPECIES: alpha/beta fold hydrolase [Auritidibacter]PXA75842.1 lipase [Auritidibacter sp. NML120779]NIH70432.1 pimeloyl-ACP methyl ester carboxylesterase [Auritidibacter ignavus]PXA75876.1 lipase [Auritidibacter sp. NML100628]PXA75906.1 lipase [Auritidibacter sp. NML120779]RMX23661.1 alpha/beta fold hydrolase [Auritidibacter ignavus]
MTSMRVFPRSRAESDNSRSRARFSQVLAVVGASAAVVGSLFAGTISTLATVFARTVVTPTRRVAEDIRIYAIIEPYGPRPHIALQATRETTVEGRYSLTFAAGEGIARIGKIVDRDAEAGIVVREIEQIYSGDLTAAQKGSWTGFTWPHPGDAGFVSEEVSIPVERGEAPAWYVPPQVPRVAESPLPTQTPEFGEDTWAIMVHGRGSRRTEGIRALRVAGALGMPSLLISYRNDGNAPPAGDGRYGLGATEWPDVEAAMHYALSHGARQVVIFGWSMGGAVSLQLAAQSPLRDRIAGLVLDGPVINWIDVLAYQARLNRLPDAVGHLGQFMIANKWARRLAGLAAPVDLKALNWVDRAEQLQHPVLILHSEDDDFVPIGPAGQLANLRPDLVSLVRFTKARHTREWNVDPDRWEQATLSWLYVVLSGPRRVVPQLSR